MHHEQSHAVKLVAVFTQATRQGLFTVGRNVGGYDHVGVSTNRRSQCFQTIFHVAFQRGICHINADHFGEFVDRAAAAFECLFGGFIRAIFPRCFDGYGFTGANLLAGHFIGGVRVTRFDRTAHFVEGSLAEITFNQFVIQQNRTVGGSVEHFQVVLATLKKRGLRQIVINNQVGINSRCHGLNPLFRKFEEGLLAVFADVVRFVAGAHFGTFQASTTVWLVYTRARAFCAREQMWSRLLERLRPFKRA